MARSPALAPIASIPPVLIVALTGNIAAGKSAVAERLAALGAVVIDADVLAREVVAPRTPALDAIVERWGPRLRTEEGSLDRRALREIVFADTQEREALNAIVHPGVDRLRRARIEDARLAGAEIVVCDIPLLFETGLDAAFNCIVVVDAPDRTRWQRLVTHRGLSTGDARRMMDAQLPAESKRARADYVIDNDGSPDALDGKVEALWTALRARAARAG